MKSNNKNTKKPKTTTKVKSNTKKTATNNKTTKSPENKITFSTQDIALILVLLAIVIVCFMLLGIGPTLIIVIGNALILLLTRLFNKLRRRKSTRIIFNTIIVVFLLLCIGGSLAVGGFLYYVVKSAPEFDTDKLTKNESSLIYDASNNLIAELGTEKRDKISSDEVSEVFIDALVAIEDSRFYQHNGVDAARFLKAAFYQLLGKSEAGGASTLSMQMIKLTYTSGTSTGIKGIIRKFTDVYMAVFQLEKTYTKNEILEFYINNNYLGSGAYGVQQAAKTYFGKDASELNIVEAATLAGTFQSPTSKNPFSDIEDTTTRRNQVLDMMYRHGYITKEERDLAKSIPLESLLTEQDEATTAYAGYLNTVVEEAIDKYGANPYNVPMIIYTNMIASKQEGLDKIMSGESFSWENDVVQAGIAAIDVWTGKIIAIGAGRNQTNARAYNFATMIDRQIGSTAKPLFDYGPGIEYNNWSTYEQFNDTKYYYSSGQEMRNSDRTHLGWMSLRTSIELSRNVPALYAFQHVDNAKIIEFVTGLGLEPEISNGKIHEAHSIGAFNGSNPLEMAAAYAAFANGGIYYEPYSINKVIFRDTGEEITYESEGKRVMSEATAFMITDCLKSAVTNGISNGAAIYGVNVAAKTGTTNYTEKTLRDNGLPNGAVNDAWIVGYNPDVAIGVWYGYDKIYSNYYSTTISAVVQRGRVFRAAGEVLFDGRNWKGFKQPNSVVEVAIEKGSNPGLLASEYTPEEEITKEYYKEGTQPTEVSNKFVPLENVEDLKVTYDASFTTTTITWTKLTGVEKPNNFSDEYGEFGYKIYKDDTFLGFTTKSTFTIVDDGSPYGVYKVISGYENFEGNQSSGAIYTLADKNKYVMNLKVDKNITIDSTKDNLVQPSEKDVEILLNKIDVTNNVLLEITITNKEGTKVSEMTLTPGEIYTITYKVTYPDVKVTLTKERTVEIV